MSNGVSDGKFEATGLGAVELDIRTVFDGGGTYGAYGRRGRFVELTLGVVVSLMIGLEGVAELISETTVDEAG